MASVKGGDKFETYMRQMSADLSKGTSVKVGFLANAKYPDGTSVAMVAAIQNWGAPRAGIPPRPFFSNMIAAHQSEWAPALADLLRSNQYDSRQALQMAGEGIAGQLRQSIIDTNDPALSPVTLMLRKMQGEGVTVTGKTVGEARRRVNAGESTSGVSTKPLVWTGNLLNSIDYEVKE